MHRLVVLVALCSGLMAGPASAAERVTFDAPGDHVYVVPAGVVTLQVLLVGGKGGAGAQAVAGGFGARVEAELTVTPGETFDVRVAGNGDGAGTGGFGGGGAAVGFGASRAGGGGGASEVGHATGAGGARLLVAGGGGGASKSDGPEQGDGGVPGSAGGAAGEAGAGPGMTGGRPGTTTADGGGGSASTGGTGDWAVYATTHVQVAGGGGGGWFGGAGGSSGPVGQTGGGGGGSSRAPGGIVTLDTTGIPLVRITPVDPPPVVVVPGQAPAPVPPGPASDTTAPVLSKLGLTKVRFRRRAGTEVFLSLSEAATVRATVRRLRPGRRVGKACRKPSRATRKRRRCTRLTTVGTFGAALPAGLRTVALPRRLTGGRLTVGRHRLTVVATDPAGNRSKPVSVAFRVVG